MKLISTVPEDEVVMMRGTGGEGSKLHLLEIRIEYGGVSAFGRVHGILIETLDYLYIENVIVQKSTRWGIFISSVKSSVVIKCSGMNNRYGGLGMENCKNVSVLGGVYSLNRTTAPTNGYGEF